MVCLLGGESRALGLLEPAAPEGLYGEGGAMKPAPALGLAGIPSFSKMAAGLSWRLEIDRVRPLSPAPLAYEWAGWNEEEEADDDSEACAAAVADGEAEGRAGPAVPPVLVLKVKDEEVADGGGPRAKPPEG